MAYQNKMSAGESQMVQGTLPSILGTERTAQTSNRDQNKITAEDRGFHDWYRFVLSFPPHLVREYISRWGITGDQLVLDPFCGTGTTVVECKKMGVPSIGVEANPFAHFASMTKLDWQPKPAELLHNAEAIAIAANQEANLSKMRGPLRSLPDSSHKLLISGSISPLPLHRLLSLRDCIERMAEGSPFIDHYRLALARIAVTPSSNLKFGPEVGVGTPKDDAPVVDAWLNALREMAHDLESVHNIPGPPASVILGDARQIKTYIEPRSISAVFTSPPYPNEKDYSRTTRLEMTLLGFATAKPELQAIKRTLLRSNTRNVYKGDDDDQWIENNQAIQDLAMEIEKRRVALNKTSGFEKLYHKVTKLYFGGMAKHLADLRPLLKPGAYLGYVVGDQASYFQVKIRTGELLAEIAKELGYEVINLDLFRTRLATATREMLREEVLVLRWPLSEGGIGMTKPKRAQAPRRAEQPKARYAALIEHIFHSKFDGQTNIVRFDRTEFVAAAKMLNIELPKNLGDVIYSFRYRTAFPISVTSAAPKGHVWVIRPAGQGRYAMTSIPDLPITPTVGLEITKIADSTPGVVAKYSLNDEQALLAKVRYNRLVDLFTGVVCYSLQNHLRTTVADMGQVETDEIYIGVDRFGAHYVFPVQAKGGADRLNIVQIEQDLALCAEKFPGLNCTALAAQFMTNDTKGAVIALFGFQNREGGATRVLERHYRLVSPEAITKDDLANYAQTIPGALEVLRGPNLSNSASSPDEESV